MDGYPNSIHDVAEATGLTRKYIDRCYAIMGFLEAYRKRAAEENKYYYSAAAFDVFHRVAQLKSRGMNRRQIREALIKSGLGREASEQGREEKGSSPESPGRPPAPSGDATAAWIDALQAAGAQVVEALQEALAAKDAVIEAREAELSGLRERLLALPDGRTPEEIAAALADKERQDEALARLASAVKGAEDRAARRSALLSALEGLSRWSSRRKRKALLEQIRALDENR